MKTQIGFSEESLPVKILSQMRERREDAVLKLEYGTEARESMEQELAELTTALNALRTYKFNQ